MPACRLGPLLAALLLGLLLGLPPVTGSIAVKPGECPELEGDANCTKACVLDEDCDDNLKCCQAGCATVCQMPNDVSGESRSSTHSGLFGELLAIDALLSWGSSVLRAPALLQGKDKPGSCPNVDIAFPQLGLCRDQCQVDSQCPDALKCCVNGCGRVSCVTPVF
uniref:WAP four-disulfide core domain protein 2 n=1 Tax=Bos taurus TaxID=9913 RepID=F6R695_BOVIN